MQIFAAFRFGNVGETNFVQNFLRNVQRHLGPRVAQIRCAGTLFPLLLQAYLLGGRERGKAEMFSLI